MKVENVDLEAFPGSGAPLARNLLSGDAFDTQPPWSPTMRNLTSILTVAALTASVACAEAEPQSDAQGVEAADQMSFQASQAIDWVNQGGAATVEADGPALVFDGIARVAPGRIAPGPSNTDAEPEQGANEPDCEAPRSELEAEICDAAESAAPAPEEAGCPVASEKDMERNPEVAELAQACKVWQETRPEVYIMTETAEVAGKDEEPRISVSYVIADEAPYWLVEEELREGGPMMVDVYRALAQVMRNGDVPVEVEYAPSSAVAEVRIATPNGPQVLKITVEESSKREVFEMTAG